MSAYNIFIIFSEQTLYAEHSGEFFWEAVSSLYFQAFIKDPDGCDIMQCARKQESYIIPKAQSPAPALLYSCQNWTTVLFVFHINITFLEFSISEVLEIIWFDNFIVYIGETETYMRLETCLS